MSKAVVATITVVVAIVAGGAIFAVSGGSGEDRKAAIADVGPGFSVNDVNVTEGNSGKRAATFDVRLGAPLTAQASVNVSTVNRDATAPEDFEALSNYPLTFAAGETAKKVTVNVNGDEDFENAEQFDVQLSGASGATIADATGTGTIYTDDTDWRTYIKVDDVSVKEGNSGTKIAKFTISRNNAGEATSQLRWYTKLGTAGPDDFGSNAGAVIQMQLGVHTVTAEVPIVGDTTREGTETFEVELAEVMGFGSVLSDPIGVGTIYDND